MSAPATLIISGTAHPLRWNLTAHYRLQGLANPPAIAALKKASAVAAKGLGPARLERATNWLKASCSTD